MNVNLYYPRDNENIISFSMLDTINSINIFVFQIGAAPTTTTPPPPTFISTRLVSGYEKGLRNISMKIQSVSSSYDRHAYFVSCVRAPYVLLRLMAHRNFTRPVAPVVVKCDGETQVWHVLGVCKGRELLSIGRIRGVTACVNGVETYIGKELIALSGNLPSAFVSALTRNAPNVQDVDVMKLIYPTLQINNEDVIVEL